jgi:hypothetical protein
MLPRRHAQGNKVYYSPEFRAFAEKFGIVWDIGTVELNIHLTVDEMVITQTYKGSVEKENEQEPVETPTVHTGSFRAFIPPVSGASFKPKHTAEK